MNKVLTNTDFPRRYSNIGQHAEQVARFTLTGKICKADNKPHDLSADCLNFQIKGARATVCRGTDLKAYLDRDAATAFIYVTADFETMYIMSRAEYEEFVNEFGTVTRESSRNGGTEKIRLGYESKRMREWLESRA